MEEAFDTLIGQLVAKGGGNFARGEALAVIEPEYGAIAFVGVKDLIHLGEKDAGLDLLEAGRGGELLHARFQLFGAAFAALIGVLGAEVVVGAVGRHHLEISQRGLFAFIGNAVEIDAAGHKFGESLLQDVVDFPEIGVAPLGGDAINDAREDGL